MKHYFFSRERILLGLIAFSSTVALIYGWKTFWFLTDDAFIAFRYVSNSQLGIGYTWNLPPFPPVEGYTSFLWVVLLDLVWRVAGIEPPESANWLSLAFALGTLALTMHMFLCMSLRPALVRFRVLLFATLLFAILTNRTFLAWTSSGLETAMFNFFVLLWVFACLYLAPGTKLWMFSLVGAATLISLTRPDGYLFLAITFALGVPYLVQLWQKRSLTLSSLFVFSPALMVAAHVLWRKWFYGEWLPNTSIAKSIAPWPESGARYMLSFILEYALWFWLGLIALFIFRELAARCRPSVNRSMLNLSLTRNVVALAVIFALFGQVFYYTVFIGGDHFEYRIYSDLIPLIFLSTVWVLNRMLSSPRLVFAVWSGFVLCSLPIPWLHWSASQAWTTRDQTYKMKVAVAPLLPSLLRPYGEQFDNMQFWLIDHFASLRHQENKVFADYLLQTMPARAEGMRLSASDHPMLVAAAVGVVSWVMPTTNILDTFGLNDSVIAHNPPNLNGTRLMAHDRFPPPGYIECFQPNIQILNFKTIIIAARKVEPQALIANCTHKNWDRQDTSSVTSQPLDSGLDDSLARFLKSSWLRIPLFLYLAPNENRQEHRTIISAFQNYAGDGCGVSAPASKKAEDGNSYFLLSFLVPAGDAVPAELAQFNQTRHYTTLNNQSPTQYALGYTLSTAAAPPLEPTISHSFQFGNGITLNGYELTRSEFRAGEKINLTLYYSVAHAPPPANFYIILRPTSHSPQQHAIVHQIDNPCFDLAYAADLTGGTLFILKTTLIIPPQAPPNTYTLSTGFSQRSKSNQVETLQQISVSAP